MNSLISESKRILLTESGTPKYGCLMAMINERDVDRYVDIFKKIIPMKEDLHENGFELEPHITVLYGFHLDFDSRRLQKFCAPYFPINVKLTGISTFTGPAEYDVVKFDVDTSASVLRELNYDLTRSFRRSISPSEYAYTPHMTVAYVRKGYKITKQMHSAAAALVDRTLTFESLLYSLPEKQGRLSITPSSK